MTATKEQRSDPSTDEPRLDPFLLPSGTSTRFALLISAQLIIVGYFGELIAGAGEAWTAAHRSCVAAADRAPAVGPFLSCVAQVNWSRALVVAGAALLSLVVTVAGYRLAPRLILRAEPYAELAEVAPPAMIPVPAGTGPQLLVAPLRRFSGGRAFGAYPRYFVRFDMNLITGDPRRFTAVYHHELAHLANRDVDITFLAVASLWGSLVVSVPLAIAGMAVTPDAILAVSWRLIVLFALLIVIRSAVVRVREHYADVRASASDPDAAKALDAPDQRRTPWRLHPPNSTRRKVLADPGRLMRLDFMEAAATGLFVGLAHLELANLVHYALAELPEPVSSLVSGILPGALTAAVVGVGAWRAISRAVARGDRPPYGWAAGTGLATGILAAQFVALPRPYGLYTRYLVQNPLGGTIMAAVLVAGCVLLVRWFMVAAATWLGAPGRLRGGLWATLAVGAVGCGAGLSAWYDLLTYLDLGVPADSLARLFNGLFARWVSPGTQIALVLAVVCLVWAATGGVWRVLHLGGEPVAVPPPRIRLTPALWTGLITGLSAALAVYPAHMLIAQATHLREAGTAGLILASYLYVIFTAGYLIIAAPVATLLSGGRDAHGLGAVHGMLAALIALPISACGCTTWDVALQPVHPVGWFTQFGTVLQWSTAALVPALLAAIIADRFRGRAWRMPGALLRRRAGLAALITVFAGLLAYLWVTTVLHPYVAAPPRLPPPTQVAAPVPARQVCARILDLRTQEDPLTVAIQVGLVEQQAVTADSPAMAAFGRYGLDRYAVGDFDESNRAEDAIKFYCQLIG